MFIPRTLSESIKKRIVDSNKIIILYGPRQSGKTTLIKSIIDQINLKKLEINADEKKYVNILSSRDLNKLKLLVENIDLIFIDEAQRIPDIGINLKILHDNLPNLKIIATGSSSFDLANIVKEPLTGRTWTFELYPIAFHELRKINNPIELSERLNEFLIYGMYPEIFSLKNQNDKTLYLRELCTAYLYKDIFELTSSKNPTKLDALLRLLAFQIGSQVSLNELARSLNMSKDTVSTYINLLEKSFVIFRLSGYSKNLRKEVTKMDKIYFYDLGVRNAIIDSFNDFEFRDDIGKLWENYIISERKKYLAFNQIFAKQYFWRTYTGAELDYVEQSGNNLNGYEIKWSAKTPKCPVSWKQAYPKSNYSTINRDTFLEFISSAPIT